MHDESDVPWTLIADTLAGEQGESSQADREVLARWLADQPAHQRLFATARQVWETELSWTRPDVAVLKAHVSARIGADVDGEERTGQYVRRPMEPRPLRIAHQRKGILASHPLPSGIFKTQSLRLGGWFTAATLALGIVVTMFGWNAVVHPFHGRTTTSTLTYTTGDGQRANIMLPDGSTVALNVASQLDVPAAYLSGDRTVRLRGEGLFTVARQVGKPFTVIAGDATARVLGTSFVVRRYASDGTTLVAVRDGKVAVRSRVLTANQQVEVGPAGMSSVQPADVAAFSFETGVLTLKTEPLLKAIPELDRWYAADIRIGDAALATQQIQGRVAAGSLAELSAMLEWTFNMRVVRDGRVLTLFSR